MKFKVIPGKNNKFFVYIYDITTKQDLELYDVVKKILGRDEYKFMGQGFNKMIHYDYIFNDYLFPVQFWADVRKQLIGFLPEEEVILENEHLLVSKLDFSYEYFQEWLETYKFPDKIDITSDEYKYQRESVYLAIMNSFGARIEVAMAGGKTFITYMYCRFLIDHDLIDKRKILIVVPSKTLAIQLKDDFKEYEEHIKDKIYVESIYSGAMKVLDAKVICGTYHSLGEYEIDYFSDFGAFICDELHRAKAYTIRNEIYAKLYNCEFFFGMTGTTPEYKTLDYLHIVSMFGSRLVLRTVKENIDAGVSTPIHVYKIKIKYSDENDSNFSVNLKEKGIVGTEKYQLEKKFFQTHKKRTGLVAKLLKKYTKTTLIIVDTVEYCEMLKDELSVLCPEWEFVIIHGNVKNRSEIILNAKGTFDNYCIIGTFGTMSTGVSINNLENLYLLDGGKSEIRIRQTYGRILRLFAGKLLGRMFDFQDQVKFCSFLNHSRERNRIYREQKLPSTDINITI